MEHTELPLFISSCSGIHRFPDYKMRMVERLFPLKTVGNKWFRQKCLVDETLKPARNVKNHDIEKKVMLYVAETQTLLGLSRSFPSCVTTLEVLKVSLVYYRKIPVFFQKCTYVRASSVPRFQPMT